MNPFSQIHLSSNRDCSSHLQYRFAALDSRPDVRQLARQSPLKDLLLRRVNESGLAEKLGRVPTMPMTYYRRRFGIRLAHEENLLYLASLIDVSTRFS